MLFPLDQIIHTYDLSHLDAPFTIEEIEDVMKEMTTDRSPGPDGLNGSFF
jgi:hypothetical protein